MTAIAPSAGLTPSKSTSDATPLQSNPTSSSTETVAAIPSEEKEGIPPPAEAEGWRKDTVQIIPDNNLPLVFAGLMLTTFLAALDQTIVATANPTIIRDLGGDNAAYSWVGVAYLLTATAMAPVYGKLAGIIGRKPVYYFAILCFLFGSAMCGAAQNIVWLCVCRGVQGIGGGGILQLTQIIISDIVPLATRGKWSGLLGSVWGIAAVLGPLIGGLLTDHVSWRWCFFINLPTGGVAFAVLFFNLHLNPHVPMTLRKVVQTFDFLGLFLLLAGVVMLLVGFNFGESGWGEARTIVLLVLGVVTLLGAVYVEITTKRSQIIPPRLFKTRTTACILLMVFMHAFGFISGSYYLPLYFQIRGASATLSGVKLMPFSLGSAITSIISGFLLVRLKKYRAIIITSFAFCTLGFALLATWDESSNEGKQIMYLFIAAVGVGPLFQVPLVALQASMPVAEMATSTATYGLIRSLGGTIGISVGGAIYASELNRRLAAIPGYVPPASDNLRALSEIKPLALRQEVLHAYTRSLSTIWIIAAPLLFIGLILSFCLRHYSIDRTVVRANITDAKKEGESAAEGGVPIDGIGSEKVVDEEAAGEGLEMKAVKTTSNASEETVGEISGDSKAVKDDVQKVNV